MDALDPPSVASLTDVQELLRHRRVAPVLWCGRPCYAKRGHHARGHERLLLWAAPLLRHWLAPGVAFRPPQRAPGLPYEARRLAELRARDCRVPHLLAANAEVLVTQDAGRSVERQMRAEPARRSELACRVAVDLAVLHAVGEWHGGAQVRNVVLDELDRLVRIDFDLALDRHFPLPILQAIDALLFFGSLAAWSDALAAAAPIYLQHAPPAARAVLARGRPLLGDLAGWRLLQRLAPKEGRRLDALAALLGLL